MSAVGILARDAGEPVILVVLAVLAMTGVFFLFATAAGLVRFSEEANSQNLLDAWCEADGEGLHLVSPDGWVAYSSTAFGRLLDVDDVTDGRWLDRALLHSSGGLEAAYRLAQAAATRQPWTEDVELQSGTQLRIAISHMQAPDGELLVAWRVTDRTAEAAGQGKANPGLSATLLDGLPCAALMLNADGTATLNARLSGRLGLDTSRRDPIAVRHLTSRAAAQRLSDLVSGLEPGRSARTTVTFINGAGHEQPLTLALSGPSRLPGSAAIAVITDDLAAAPAASDAAKVASGPVDATLARFVEGAPVAIAAVDQHGRIGKANPALLACLVPTAARRRVCLTWSLPIAAIACASPSPQHPHALTTPPPVRPWNSSSARTIPVVAASISPARPAAMAWCSTPLKPPSRRSWRRSSRRARRCRRWVNLLAASPTTSATR
jgi:two-component system, cell cycle sensor histidine kinase and response regulator CckA